MTTPLRSNIGSPLTPAELEATQRMVALRLSVNSPNAGLSWGEWAGLVRGRLSVVELFTSCGERPSFGSVLQLAADVQSLLVLLNRAFEADPFSEDEAA